MFKRKPMKLGEPEGGTMRTFVNNYGGETFDAIYTGMNKIKEYGFTRVEEKSPHLATDFSLGNLDIEGTDGEGKIHIDLRSVDVSLHTRTYVPAGRWRYELKRRLGLGGQLK
ncbi:MAG: hypothetical protein KKB29_00505 [Nanoarchaeota archaeon]|nr:hypothetical protein [Nanoarchaeota archaeon]